MHGTVRHSLAASAQLRALCELLEGHLLPHAVADRVTAEIRDELRCPKCNRGPGTQNDFRMRIEGDVAELQRGKVYLRDGNQLSIPTPEGVLEVVITAQTEIDDGEPAPDAEIRVEGTIVGNVVEATRLEVLCPAPAPIPDAETPPGTEPPTPEPSGPLL